MISDKYTKLVNLLGQSVIIDGELKEFGNFRISGTLNKKEYSDQFIIRTSTPYNSEQYSRIVFMADDCSEIRTWNGTPNILLK